MGALVVSTERLAVTIAEGSRMTSLSKGTIRGYARSGRIKTVKIGRRRIVPVSTLESLVWLGIESGSKTQ